MNNLSSKKIIIFLASFILLLISFFLIMNYFKATLKIKTNPSNANIKIDDKKKGVSPKNIKVSKGEHTLIISKNGFLDHLEELEIKQREIKEINIDLVPDLAEYLPENNADFKIEYGEENGYKTGFVISLYAILNNDSQLEYYNEQLKIFKKEALEWLQNKGVDTEKTNIEWLPPEAKDL